MQNTSFKIETMTSLAHKIFKNPQYFRNILLESNLIKGDLKDYSGKTFICVSLTRFCPVGCKFCFFKSGPVFRQPTREDILTEEGVQKFINFANNINLGYLLVSGGGEPMMEKKSILKIIEKVNSERIVLVTSAHWAKKEDGAKRYLDAICEALQKRKTKTKLTIRVSIDSGHQTSLTLSPVINLINLFSEHYKTVNQLDFQIHSLNGDPTIDYVVDDLKDKYKISRKIVTEKRISDGEQAIKIVPKQEIISFSDFDVKVGYAKMFFSDLRVNLQENIEKNITVYQKDLYESEDGNSSTVTNSNGNLGLDFWVNYNGNVTTWGNQFLDNLLNLYTDEPSEIILKSLSDPAAFAFIEKGADYRDKVVMEVNEIAVKRSKAVNIRDYTGALLFDEARTRLYFTIRALQDFKNEGRVAKVENKQIKEILDLSKEDLMNGYDNASYTIVEQTIEKGYEKNKVLDILEWIKLGHYKLNDDQIQKLISFYNEHNQNEPIQSLNSIQNDIKMQIVRMTEHLTHIKPKAINTTVSKAA